MRKVILYYLILIKRIFSIKAAIHCHAGLGRTGLFIACYLIFSHRMTAKEAIYFIREKRPGSVQMQQQIDTAKEFEKYLIPLRVVYFDVYEKNKTNNDATSSRLGVSSSRISLSTNGTFSCDCSFNLGTFLHRQKLILHGKEAKKLKYIPKVNFSDNLFIKSHNIVMY